MDLSFLKNLFGDSDAPLTDASLRKIVSRTLTPLLRKIGLTKYDGELGWFSDFNQGGIRRVFKYKVLKGGNGLLIWGVCFRHIPTVSASKSLQYHLTEKNIALHVWDWPRGYSRSLEEDIPATELVSHASEKECKRTLIDVYLTYQDEIEQWYAQTDSLSGSLEVVNKQIATGGSYKMRWPSGNYVKIFLLALLGDKVSAKELLARSAETASKGSADWKAVTAQVENVIDSL